MRKALVVGIDHYEHIGQLFGCVNNANSVKTVLERNGDGSVNFGVNLLVGSGEAQPLNKLQLKDAVEELFKGDPDVALFYFAGHGSIERTGGYILATDSSRGDDGLSLADVITLAHGSRAKNKIILLDSCHSGSAGTTEDLGEKAILSEGMTILTASTAEQYALEEDKSGVFTTLLVDALNGAAANLVGNITPGSVYAHIDQSLGPWDQRPLFKTNVESFVSLRSVTPSVELEELRRITEFFPAPGADFQLDPSFEPRDEGRTAEMPPADPVNTQIFAILQKFNRVNLLKPVGVTHMWDAAMESKTCKLTVLGEFYRKLVHKGRL